MQRSIGQSSLYVTHDFLKIGKGRAPTNAPKDKKIDDDVQSLTLKK